MVLKLFEFVEQVKMECFLLKLTQIEKIESIVKIFNSLGNLITFSFFEIRSRSRFRDLYIFAVRVYLPCNKERTVTTKEMNVKPQSEVEPEQILRLFPKKTKNYPRLYKSLPVSILNEF